MEEFMDAVLRDAIVGAVAAGAVVAGAVVLTLGVVGYVLRRRRGGR
jgi:hypothetical protein